MVRIRELKLSFIPLPLIDNAIASRALSKQEENRFPCVERGCYHGRMLFLVYMFEFATEISFAGDQIIRV